MKAELGTVATSKPPIIPTPQSFSLSSGGCPETVLINEHRLRRVTNPQGMNTTQFNSGLMLLKWHRGVVFVAVRNDQQCGISEDKNKLNGNCNIKTLINKYSLPGPLEIKRLFLSVAAPQSQGTLFLGSQGGWSTDRGISALAVMLRCHSLPQ